jgi:hypothetical protein
MKNILYLFLAVTIFACSSDDSSNTNDNSNQTFLERYDGVVWRGTIENEHDVRVQFINSPMSWVYYDDVTNPSICETYLFNDETQNPQMNLINNSGNILTIEEMSDYPIQYSFTVNEVDNTLTLEETAITSYTVFERTTLTDPCE